MRRTQCHSSRGCHPSPSPTKTSRVSTLHRMTPWWYWSTLISSPSWRRWWTRGAQWTSFTAKPSNGWGYPRRRWGRLMIMWSASRGRRWAPRATSSSTLPSNSSTLPSTRRWPTKWSRSWKTRFFIFLLEMSTSILHLIKCYKLFIFY